MIFPYVSYETDPSPSIPSGVIHRPEIRIRVIRGLRSIQVSGLLDTGADNVFASASLAAALGVEMRGAPEQALGAGSHELEVWPGSVEIEIDLDGESYRWPVEIGFLTGDDEPPVAYLGHAGFLEHFKAIFDTENWLVELIPHNNGVSSA